MRKYHAPEGATSISIDGESFDVNKAGLVAVPEHASHEAMLAHGYRLDGDAIVVADAIKAGPDSLEWKLAQRASELDGFEASLADKHAAANARAAELDSRESDLATRTEQFEQSIKTATADLDARAGELVTRAAELDQREADLKALAALSAPPPPPSAADLPTKKK